MSFSDDKGFGDDGTSAVTRYLSRLGLYCNTPSGNFPSFDISARGTFEVKRDRLASQTGNVFLEVSACGKPSGIATTKAAALVLIAEPSAFFVSTESLRAILPTLALVDARDGKRGHIIPVRTLAALPYIHRADLRGLLP